MPHPTATVDRVSLPLKIATIVTIAFNVLFPKGGFTISNIPITWGYLMLFASSFIWISSQFLRGRPIVSKKHAIALVCQIPLQLSILFTLIFYGSSETGKTVSILANTIILPTIFFLLLGTFFNKKEHQNLIFKATAICATLAAAYGIILFFYYLKTKSLLDIPFLTSNGTQDIAVDTKNNSRGEFLKLVSTYNNGNIYGACTLMLLPLCAYAFRNTLSTLPIKVAIVLTLSRTAWIGLVAYELLTALKNGKNLIKNLILLIIGSIILVATIYFLLTSMGKDLNWLFDSNLGGRIRLFDRSATDNSIYFFGFREYSGIGEIVYLGMLYCFGVFGLGAFLIAMFGTPIFLLLNHFRKIQKDAFSQSLLLGIFLYAIIATADGAYSFIPTIAIYTFMVSLFCGRVTSVHAV